ncbi:MAG TPA: hypothetical protein VFP55_05495 [Solirubrobacteraceae bacterium]|nr:hypothetical protein [Solirubrobacteraceae bacterium]
MTLVPIAAFLAGALLTILLPIGLLIVLSVWYWFFSVGVPETVRRRRSGSETPPPNPGPNIPQSLPPDPGH